MKLWWCLPSVLVSAALLAQTPPADSEDAPAPEATPPAKAEGATPAPTPVPAPAPQKPNAKGVGANKKVGAPGPTTPVAKVIKPLPPCTTYSATPLDSAVLEFEKKIYFTSPKMPSDSGAATMYLIEADIAEGKSKRVAGFKSGNFVSLIAHDKKPETISILDFSKGKPECGEGLTSGTAIKLNVQKATPSYPLASYGFIPGDIGANLGDLDKGHIQALDLTTGQKRILETFSLGTRPLYLKVSPPIALYAYNPESRELAKYIANKKTPDIKLKLKEDMRLVRDGDKFGVATINGRKLQIAEIKGWSGDEMKTFDLDLPPEFSTVSPAIKAKFADDRFLVIGKDDASKKTLRTVLYYQGKDLKAFKAPDQKSYFSEADFGVDGSVTLLLSEVDSNVVRELWIAKDKGEPKKIDVLKVKKPAVKPTKMR